MLMMGDAVRLSGDCFKVAASTEYSSMEAMRILGGRQNRRN